MTTEEKKKLRKVLETVFRDTKMWSSEFGANQNIFKLTLEFNGINFGTYRMILRMRGDNPIMALAYVNSGKVPRYMPRNIPHPPMFIRPQSKKCIELESNMLSNRSLPR